MQLPVAYQGDKIRTRELAKTLPWQPPISCPSNTKQQQKGHDSHPSNVKYSVQVPFHTATKAVRSCWAVKSISEALPGIIYLFIQHLWHQTRNGEKEGERKQKRRQEYVSNLCSREPECLHYQMFQYRPGNIGYSSGDKLDNFHQQIHTTYL
jgi:hypothetical protein